MKVSFKDFGANVPDKERYEHGVDYLWHDFDLEFEDASYLIENLKNNHSAVIIYTSAAVIDFYIFDNELNVQIDADGFWHQSNIDLTVAKEILRAAWDERGDFGSQVPSTDYEWDVY